MHLTLQSGACYLCITPVQSGACYLVITPTQVHLGLRSGATATLVNGRVSSSYEHRLGETRSICNREST